MHIGLLIRQLKLACAAPRNPTSSLTVHCLGWREST